MFNKSLNRCVSATSSTKEGCPLSTKLSGMVKQFNLKFLLNQVNSTSTLN